MTTTWVLILVPDSKDGWPAVIGGYASREEAYEAGKRAMADESQYLNGYSTGLSFPDGVTKAHGWNQRHDPRHGMCVEAQT